MQFAVSADLKERIKGLAPYIGSFIGVDVGTSSIKIVQLSVQNDVVILETYGEVSNAPYDANLPPGKAPDAITRSDALSDLLHAVDAQSRSCAVGVSLSESFVNVIDAPRRDPEQMRKLIPGEIQKFIPMPVEKVMLDWYPLTEEKPHVFDVLLPHAQATVEHEKVVVVAVNNDTAYRLETIAGGAQLRPSFFEIEMFGIARACPRAPEAPALIFDLGASATKAYILNEHLIPVGARVIPVGGLQLTQEIMKSQSIDVAASEELKRTAGLGPQSTVAPIIEQALEPLWSYAHGMLQDHAQLGGKKVERVLLCGGGSYMPGIVDMVAAKLALPVDVIHAFDRTKGPMILEYVLKEDGPRYAVALGLALRGIGR